MALGSQPLWPRQEQLLCEEMTSLARLGFAHTRSLGPAWHLMMMMRMTAMLLIVMLMIVMVMLLPGVPSRPCSLCFPARGIACKLPHNPNTFNVYIVNHEDDHSHDLVKIRSHMTVLVLGENRQVSWNANPHH